MAKKKRTYWIQLCYDDNGPDVWLESFSNYNDTCVTAGGLLVKRKAVRALILRHWCRQDSMAATKDILADLDCAPRPATKILKIEL